MTIFYSTIFELFYLCVSLAVRSESKWSLIFSFSLNSFGFWCRDIELAENGRVFGSFGPKCWVAGMAEEGQASNASCGVSCRRSWSHNQVSSEIVLPMFVLCFVRIVLLISVLIFGVGLFWVVRFYTEAFGMTLLRKRDIPDEKYSNAFLGFGPEDSHFVVELTYSNAANLQSFFCSFLF